MSDAEQSRESGAGGVSGDAGLDAVLGRLAAALADANRFDLTSLVRLDGPSTGLLAAGAEVERLRRTVAVFDRHYVAALEAGDEARRRGCPNTATLLRAQLRLSPSEARARVAAAAACSPREELGVGTLPARCAVLATAQEVGALSPEQTDVVIKALDQLPDQLDAEQVHIVESLLVGDAATFSPGQLAARGRRLLEQLDPDSVLRDDEWAQKVRTASLVRRNDGTGELRAHLTPLTLEVWQTVLDPLAKPVPSSDDSSHGPAGPDPRTSGQRLHDGLLDAGQRLLAGGALPASGGAPTTLLLLLADAGTGAGASTDSHAGTGAVSVSTAHGSRLPLTAALRAADEAEVATLTLDTDGVPLRMGRSVRVATRAQTLALVARDRGCVFPGCDRPPAWTQRHHIRPWHQGGSTNTDNMCLLCGYHHRSFESLGWECLMIGGRPWWRPPAWIDPTRTPVRNTMFDDVADTS